MCVKQSIQLGFRKPFLDPPLAVPVIMTSSLCVLRLHRVISFFRIVCRDISFLCDATNAQKKTTQLPPLTDRGGVEVQQVSCVVNVMSSIENRHMGRG